MLDEPGFGEGYEVDGGRCGNCSRATTEPHLRVSCGECGSDNACETPEGFTVCWCDEEA